MTSALAARAEGGRGRLWGYRRFRFLRRVRVGADQCFDFGVLPIISPPPLDDVCAEPRRVNEAAAFRAARFLLVEHVLPGFAESSFQLPPDREKFIVETVRFPARRITSISVRSSVIGVRYKTSSHPALISFHPSCP